MTLRRRLLVLLAAATTVVAVLAAVLAAWPSWRGFDQVERQALHDDGRRLSAALQRESERLLASTADWGHLDDTSAYVRGQAPGYEASNLTPATLHHLDVSDLAIVATDGTVLWAGHRHVDVERLTRTVPELTELAAPGGALHPDAPGGAAATLVRTRRGVSLVAATPVGDGDAVRSPAGVILMSQDLDRTYLAGLSDRLQRDVALERHEPDVPEFRVVGEEAELRVPLRDVEGAVVADAVVRAPRHIAAVGRRAIVRLVAAVVLAVVGLAAAALVVVDRSVVRRLRSMRDDALAIQRDGVGSVRPIGGDDELADLAATLNDMVGSLAAAQARLAHQNDELAELARMRQELVSVVSHELRTPLTAIQGFATTLRRHDDLLGSARRGDLAMRIERNARRLDRLVSDLLVLSRADQGEVSSAPEPVALAPMVAELAEDVGVEVERDIPADAAVFADPDHLRRMLANLLTNARKYGASPFRVEVSQHAERTCIAVRDAGGGVPAEFVDRLFDRFTQASTGDVRTAQGVGLGLSIVRTLAAANAGSVRYVTGPGATFELDLPTAAAPTPVRADVLSG